MTGRKNKKQNFFLSTKSDEYQRMLSGLRVYFILMSENGFFSLILFGLLFSSVLAIILEVFKDYVNIEVQLPTVGIFIFVYFVMMGLFQLFILYKEYDFSIKKGLKVFVRNSLSLLFIGFTVIILLLMTYDTDPNTSIVEKISISLFFIFFMFSFILLMQYNGEFKSSSLIKYAKEKLNKTIRLIEEDSEKKRESLFEQYYYSILAYYRRVTKLIKMKYKDDVIIKLGIKKIPILCSQVISNDKEQKIVLSEILGKLENYEPLKSPDEYSKTMDEIEEKYAGSLNFGNGNYAIEEIFKKRALIFQIKTIIPILTIISIIINIILNIF